MGKKLNAVQFLNVRLVNIIACLITDFAFNIILCMLLKAEKEIYKVYLSLVLQIIMWFINLTNDTLIILKQLSFKIKKGRKEL